MQKQGMFTMGGSEKTFQYVVVAASGDAKVGIRKLGGGQTRIRFEATNAVLKRKVVATAFATWKQPDSEKRYSLVADNKKEANTALLTGISTLVALGPVRTNPRTTAAFKALVAKARKNAKVKPKATKATADQTENAS